MQVKELTTVAIEAGKKVHDAKASSGIKNYLRKVEEGSMTSENCPHGITFNLGNLENYLKEVRAEFDRLNIPETDRAVNVMPVIYNGEKRFNITIAPCVKDEEGTTHHKFKVTNDTDPLDWILEGFNLGMLTP
ncbi:hypothetical protein ACI6Q2_17550 [Chitinophagaceae bacterium LWZ2-11]